MKRFVRGLLLMLLLLAFSTTSLADAVPYTVRLDASTKIYKGPGADTGVSKNVGEDGVYTIVEEAADESGNLWGRLKSGAGWVMLEENSGSYREVPYTVSLKASAEIWESPCRGYLTNVGKDGVYTIVEEVLGNDGFIWGRLKSGAGWVRLTKATSPSTPADASYTVSLEAWAPVYSAPGAGEGKCVGIVGEDGVYTIVRETTDELGNLWGKLKSGAGWVNLSYVRFAGHPPMTAYFAQDIPSIADGRCDCIVSGSADMQRIAFRANETLRNVKFETIRYDGNTYATGESHCMLYRMEEGGYFVAGVVFYGDMTTYGISFTDEDGIERRYAVMLSGMDGSVVMNEYFL